MCAREERREYAPALRQARVVREEPKLVSRGLPGTGKEAGKKDWNVKLVLKPS